MPSQIHSQVAPDMSYRQRQGTEKPSFTFFGMRRNTTMKQKQEDINISFLSLAFSDEELEKRYRKSRVRKFRNRLRFGAMFTSFFIPLLVAMQIEFKKHDTEKWARFPLVMVFPGVVFAVGVITVLTLDKIQERPYVLTLLCLVGQISALLDTTTAGTVVNERNVWVQFIFSLGITSSTGLTFVEAQFVSTLSSIVFITLAWVRYSADLGLDGVCNAATMSSTGTSMAAVILYSILLSYLSWNWEFEERRDFILTERLAQENVMVQMTMEMTGWFSGGAAEKGDAMGGGVLSKSCHIEPKDVDIQEELGCGTFGSVYSAMWKETKVAVKKLILIGDTQQIMTSFGSEASLMAQLRHPNVVMFLGVMVHPEFVGVVMELCPKGSVYAVMHQDSLSLDWSLYLRMLNDAARGMNFLHRNSPAIIHRDLKSLNLLIDADWRCKVSDFGLSKLQSYKETEQLEDSKDTEVHRAFAGTAMWLAPEIFNGEEHTEASDVFSFGIILYEVLSRSTPYASISSEAVPFVVQSGKRPTDFNEITEEDPNLGFLAELMASCWAADPKERPSFSTIISTLQNIVSQYIGKTPWEDHVVFPDRNTAMTSEISTKFSIEEKDLVVGEPIGKGVFGAVYEGSYFGTAVAIKKLFISGVATDVLKDFNKECSIMQRLRHPNIVLFMGSCSNPPNLLLVTELLVNGSFFDIYHKKVKPPTNELLKLCLDITIDMARGLAYLHNHDPVIIHRDLKSQNIMLDEKMTTKIGDFGLSKFREVGKTMSICGSPLWVAPEVLRGEKYGCACDVYSFGIIVWEALAWSEPYPSMGSSEVMNGVACGLLRPTLPIETPEQLGKLLKLCWSTKPEARPSFDELVPLIQELKLEGAAAK